MNKKKIFIIVSIFAAIGLVVMLFMLPKPRTNNSAKHETSTETSTSKKNDKKDDKKDNKQSDKKDSKKDDKKEDKKEDTSTTSETPVTPTTEITTTETQNNNTGSSVTNTPTTNTTPSQPDPQPIYQTIHHDEVGHYETQVIAEAWDEPIYERKIIGNQTGTVYNSLDEWGNSEDGSYHVGDVQVGTTHHDAVTQQVWVVDQYAWDETIIVGYK
ncbi:hypothetical protein [Solobacterium moorei]|uniref:hypothetical protein n=1 Tax=Solobacterium moorei TaxID=102148 RepID=UPI0003FB879E|nr:hypothetical protein [Solobacterium moorei]BET20944.1 hypothetical protein RGT18_05320 [Solobacterium moorei]